MDNTFTIKEEMVHKKVRMRFPNFLKLCNFPRLSEKSESVDGKDDWLGPLVLVLRLEMHNLPFSYIQFRPSSIIAILDYRVPPCKTFKSAFL